MYAGNRTKLDKRKHNDNDDRNDIREIKKLIS